MVVVAVTRVRDFTRRNTLEFFGFNLKKHPQELIKKILKHMDIIGVTAVYKVKLSFYQHTGVSQVLLNKWNEN